jgi:hypothetical protein
MKPLKPRKDGVPSSVFGAWKRMRKPAVRPSIRSGVMSKVFDTIVMV